MIESTLKGRLVSGQMEPPSEEKDSRHNRRHQTERRQADLPNRAGKPRLLAHPRKPAPQHCSGEGSTQRYSDTANANHPQPLLLALQVQCPQAHPHLRGSHQAGIGGERQRTQSTNHPVCCFRIMTACLALIEMGPQPGLLRIRETFTQSDQLPCLVMCVPRHACAPFSRDISMFSPRYSRDLTVPSRAPVTVAISFNANPS